MPETAIAAEKESNVHLDTASNSSPFASFRRSWSCSILRLLAEEICNFPRRIQSTLVKTHLRFGYTLPLYPTFDSKESRGQGYAFLCACSEDIKKLRRDNPWAGCLDLELAGAAYQAGAHWAIHFFRKEATSMGSESLSCDQLSQVPNVGSDASGHSRSDSQAGMDADEIIVSKVQSTSGF